MKEWSIDNHKVKVYDANDAIHINVYTNGWMNFGCELPKGSTDAKILETVLRMLKW